MYPTRLYREQHTRIRALCAPLATAGRASASSAEIRSALAKLAGIVKLHLRDEDMQLYPRLFKHEDRAVRDVATTFRATMGSLAEDFRSFYERWIAPDTLELH
jgi:hemerythrin HHE cation binding domain-containing protein